MPRAWLWVAATLFVGCITLPPHVIINVKDPDGLAQSATTIAIGEDLDEMSPVAITDEGFPFKFVIWHRGPTAVNIWVDALDVGARTLARGRVGIRIEEDDIHTATVELGRYCDAKPAGSEADESLRCAMPEDEDGRAYTGVCSPTGACTTKLPVCGDGNLEGNESCDDGYADLCGSCNEDCTAAGAGAVCGDGDLCPETEACDDGYTDGCGICNQDCSGPGTGDLGSCGDGIRCAEGTEECDDGNTLPGDGCNAICLKDPGCGNETCNVNRPSFPVSGDQNLVRTGTTEPVVTDSSTGLEWQGCVAGLAGSSCTTGNAELMLWAEALQYCWNLSWNGHGDWYLPDEFELHSIIDYATNTPAIDLSAFPNTPYEDEYDREVPYWTSSFHPQPRNAMFGRNGVVGFKYGELNYGTTTHNQETGPPYHVRCVRRGSYTVSQRFARYAGDEPVAVDNATGLVWQGCVSGLSGDDCGTGAMQDLTWAQASTYCDELSWAGLDIWRIPDAKELRSIVDNRQYYDWEVSPAIDNEVFPETPPWPIWTSTTTAGSPGTMWFVHFSSGAVKAHGVEYAETVARCVRE